MPDIKTAVPIGRTPFLAVNPRPAKMFLDTGIEQVAGHASREGHWGWDGACLESVSAIAHDPIQADINLYRYCANSPLGLTDPSGLIPGDPLSFDGSIMALAQAGWSAKDIALATGITVAAAEAYIYRAEISKGAENIIKSLTATATAANSGDPCAAAIAARKAAEKSISSFEKLIAQHQAKIADPTKYMTHPYPGLTPQQNIAIAIADWTKQIAGFQKSIDTYKIALDALKTAEYYACRCWYKPWTWF